MSDSTPRPRRRGLAAWDTLALRIFVLMCTTLVLSHVVAYTVVHVLAMPGPGPAHGLPPEGAPGGPRGALPGGPKGPPPGMADGGPPMPTWSSLPPTPGLDDNTGRPALPLTTLLLDYGIRLLLIAAAAWWGSRWLATPMARLADASNELSPALLSGQSPAPLDEHLGTREVRTTAGVFNRMASQIRQQFQSRGLMIAAISHDLRTPLTRMRLRLETATLDAQVRDRCVSDLAEMNALIDTVLEVFRSSGPPLPRHRTDVGALVQALVDDRNELGAQLRFTGPSVVATTEALALQRVLANLVDNALRYGGAPVEVELTVDQPAAQFELRVMDRGPGIPESQMTDVLQPFFRLEGSRHKSTGGTGLGLYIAQELVNKLGGQLRLNNRTGGGLTAQVTLPLA